MYRTVQAWTECVEILYNRLSVAIGSFAASFESLVIYFSQAIFALAKLLNTECRLLN